MSNQRFTASRLVHSGTRQTLRDVFHPAYPPIALQSLTRDAPFPKGDGETQCSKVRSDEVWMDQVCGGKQRRALRFHLSLELSKAYHWKA